tara:strand:- start:3144 stop:4007 length:864 start_codon:yes stop_codon:yes gene_type:complete
MSNKNLQVLIVVILIIAIIVFFATRTKNTQDEVFIVTPSCNTSNHEVSKPRPRKRKSKYHAKTSTGNVMIVPDDTCLLTFGDFQVDRFSASWNRSADVTLGGYAFTWGPSVMQYGTDGMFGESFLFQRQFALTSQADFDAAGEEFPYTKEAIVPCDDNETTQDEFYRTPATTPLKVFPIDTWEVVSGIVATYVPGTQVINLDFADLVSAPDQYAISITIPLTNFTVYRGTFVNAVPAGNNVDIQLYDAELAEIVDPTGPPTWFSVEAYGFTNSDLGDSASGSATVMF